MTHLEPILDPSAQAGTPRAATVAPRSGGLAGLRVGLLDNGKPNATLVLQTVAAQLRAQHHVGHIATYTKSYFGTPVEEDRAQEIARECDVAITGVGD